MPARGEDCDIQDYAAGEMFRKAVRDIPQMRQAAKKSVFTLSDQAPLARILEKMKKKSTNEFASAQARPVSSQGADCLNPAGKSKKKIPANENEEFLDALGNTVPLKGKGREVAPQAQPPRHPGNMDRCFEELLERNLEFSVLYSKEYMEGKVCGLDELIMGRLRAGAMSPEAHLDMHGLNAAQAYESLSYFLRDAWFKGLRVVLLVPGRGLNSPNGIGVLRQNLQSWLTQEPFKRIVLAFCTAQSYDGGPGSIYVLLRKYRKKGRIYWERLPADPDLF